MYSIKARTIIWFSEACLMVNVVQLMRFLYTYYIKLFKILYKKFISISISDMKYEI